MWTISDCAAKAGLVGWKPGVHQVFDISVNILLAIEVITFLCFGKIDFQLTKTIVFNILLSSSFVYINIQIGTTICCCVNLFRWCAVRFKVNRMDSPTLPSSNVELDRLFDVREGVVSAIDVQAGLCRSTPQHPA